MEPVNDQAKRVLAYQREHRMAHGFPTRLMRDDGSIFLPAHPGYHGAWHCAAPAETSPLPGGPRYQTQSRILLGSVRHKRGDLIQFLHWPNALGLLPLNEIAKKISAYETACSDHVDFPFAPWCLYRAGPYLPDLNGENLAEAPYRMKASRTSGALSRISA